MDNEEGDNSSSGVSSDQEVTMISTATTTSANSSMTDLRISRNNGGLPTMLQKGIISSGTGTLLGHKKHTIPKTVVVINPDEPIIDDEDRSPSPPPMGFQRHNSMTRKQAATIAMSRGSLLYSHRPPVSLVQLPPPLENDSENESSGSGKKPNGGTVGVKKSSGGPGMTTTAAASPSGGEFIVLAPPPQFCDQVDQRAADQHRSVRIVGAVPKTNTLKNNSNSRLHTH